MPTGEEFEMLFWSILKIHGCPQERCLGCSKTSRFFSALRSTAAVATFLYELQTGEGFPVTHCAPNDQSKLALQVESAHPVHEHKISVGPLIHSVVQVCTWVLAVLSNDNLLIHDADGVCQRLWFPEVNLCNPGESEHMDISTIYTYTTVINDLKRDK